ncbi:hypothetical protein [Streptomyces sp. NPDC058457]|uniref:hypothetical protein n=1 Tax=Streptomyces sp. NPDC058457 TaxID=3346507 RepID=UPI0036559A6C
MKKYRSVAFALLVAGGLVGGAQVAAVPGVHSAHTAAVAENTRSAAVDPLGDSGWS